MQGQQDFKVLLLLLLGWLTNYLHCHEAPCDFNAMCVCWVQDDADFTKMDITCNGVPFARFPDVSISYVSQLDVIGSGLQLFDNEALSSASGVEALGLVSNQLMSIGEKSLLGVNDILVSLDLSYNSLEEIPFPALRSLKKLNWLNMHRHDVVMKISYSTLLYSLSNHLTTLEGDWGYMNGTLSNAFFGDNSIVTVPHSFATFSSLVWFNLDSNNIEELPDNVLPPNLVTLSLNFNLFKSFPASVAELKNLKWLYLKGNDIKHLQFPDFKYKRLETVDLSDNSIESISYSALENKNLSIKDLNLSGNRLSNLAKDTFSQMAIRRIYLSSNGIRSIDPKAFSGLEDTLEFINLENNELSTLPIAVSSLRQLSFLYLASNSIHELKNDSFIEFDANLKALSLATNGFETVPVNALAGCSNLLHLNLGYNKINKITLGDFEWAENLEILLLRNNFLTELKPHTFRGADKLKELSLSFNHLTDISDEAFVGLDDSLEILELSFAFSTDVFPLRALRPLNSLHWLVLDNNNFNAIEPSAFYTFQRLRYLNLESNRLIEIPERVFLEDVHSLLRDVKLGYNFIESIPESTFHNLTELRALDLTGNRIRQLTSASISECPRLVTVSLANNRISLIDRYALSGLYGLRFLHLEFNKLTILDFEAFADCGSSAFTLNVSYNLVSTLLPSISPINVTQLDLSFNNLTHLSADVFTNSPNLKIINLQNNYLTAIEPGTFSLGNLDILNLRDNHIESLRKQSFSGLRLLQQLDLSGNQLSQLTNEQFRHLRGLRVLSLARNKLRSLTRDMFSATKLEILDLSRNKFSVVPSAPFFEVEYTLRSIDLSENTIDRLDATSFKISQLTYLNLARNRIEILPDISFDSLSKLLVLNISHNYLRANFKEVFHYLSDLRHLSLANCDLKAVPHLLLNSLNNLDLSYNSIESIRDHELQYFKNLKVLLLANNKLKSIGGLKLSLLRELDVAGNPIKEFSKESFSGYPSLEKLNIRDLNRTHVVDKDSLKSLKYLKHLRTQTWPEVPNFRLRDFFKALPLRVVEIEVIEPELTDQLHYTFGKQLRELTITGRNLRYIDADTFATIESGELVLRITETQVQRFQSDVFSPLTRWSSQLSLDLRNNHIYELSPSVIYGNQSWETVGTSMISGGLQVSGNPLECDCEIAWLSVWLRRWLRESRQIHIASQVDARQLRTLAGRAVCAESSTSPHYQVGQHLNSILNADHTRNTACQASALSGAPVTDYGRRVMMAPVVLLIFGLVIVR